MDGWMDGWPPVRCYRDCLVKEGQLGGQTSDVSMEIGDSEELAGAKRLDMAHVSRSFGVCHPNCDFSVPPGIGTERINPGSFAKLKKLPWGGAGNMSATFFINDCQG